MRSKAALLQDVLDLGQLCLVPGGQALCVMSYLQLGAVAVRARRREPPHKVPRFGRQLRQFGTRGQVPPQPRVCVRHLTAHLKPVGARTTHEAPPKDGQLCKAAAASRWVEEKLRRRRGAAFLLQLLLSPPLPPLLLLPSASASPPGR